MKPLADTNCGAKVLEVPLTGKKLADELKDGVLLCDLLLKFNDRAVPNGVYLH